MTRPKIRARKRKRELTPLEDDIFAGIEYDEDNELGRFFGKGKDLYNQGNLDREHGDEDDESE